MAVQQGGGTRTGLRQAIQMLSGPARCVQNREAGEGKPGEISSSSLASQVTVTGKRMWKCWDHVTAS